MKRIAGVFGVLGGILAVVWAMRDRLVSIAAPREPEPPRFRVVPPTPREPTPAPRLTAINGIGPVYAERLLRAGIGTVESLASADADAVADAAQVSAERATAWIAEARGPAD